MSMVQVLTRLWPSIFPSQLGPDGSQDVDNFISVGEIELFGLAFAVGTFGMGG